MMFGMQLHNLVIALQKYFSDKQMFLFAIFKVTITRLENLKIKKSKISKLWKFFLNSEKNTN